MRINAKLNKGLICSSMLAFSASVVAQSNVTIYGIVDNGVSYLSNSGGGNKLMTDSSVIQPSRLGFRGTEDLGGGAKALFVLESGFDLNNGSLGQGSTTGLLFGRQSLVGLGNQYGTVTVGRQYDFLGDTLVFYAFSDFAGVYAFHRGDNDRLSGVRPNQSVKYLSNEFSGFKVGALYAFADTAASQGHTASFMTSYRNGPFTAALAYTSVNSLKYDAGSKFSLPTGFGQTLVKTVNPKTGALTTATVDMKRQQVLGLGAAYNIGDVTLRGVITGVQLQAQNGTSMSIRNYDGSVIYHFSKTLRGGVNYIRSNIGSAGVVNQYNAALDYFLSKRTDVYVSTSYENVSGGLINATLLSAAASSTKSQMVFHLGMRHRF